MSINIRQYQNKQKIEILIKVWIKGTLFPLFLLDSELSRLFQLPICTEGEDSGVEGERE